MKKEIIIRDLVCAHCKANVTKALEEIKEIETINIDLETKKALITLKQEISDNIIISKIKDAGYCIEKITAL